MKYIINFKNVDRVQLAAFILNCTCLLTNAKDGEVYELNVPVDEIPEIFEKEQESKNEDCDGHTREGAPGELGA